MEVLAIKLLLAHLLTDYFFQPTKWVEDKNENKHTSKFFWLHVCVAFVIPLVLLIGEWFQWRAALLIGITHGIIDYWKIKQEGKFSMVDVYLDLCATEDIYGFDHTGALLLDVGKPESLTKAASLFF